MALVVGMIRVVVVGMIRVVVVAYPYLPMPASVLVFIRLLPFYIFINLRFL